MKSHTMFACGLVFSTLISACATSSADVPTGDSDAYTSEISDLRTATASRRCSAALNRKARAFMRTARMIRSGEESSIPDLGIDIKWSCRKVVRMNATSDYVVMGLAAAQEGPERDSSYEVLVANAAGVLQKFESVVRIPAKARFAVGSCAVDSTISIARNCAPALAPNSPLNYYVELEGESVADAMKALAADLPYGGFSATAVLGGKAPYDTSTDFRPRDWKVTNAKYSLRRGTTAEVFDIQPQDLDGMIYRDADTGALLPQHRFDPAYRAVFWGRGVRSIEVAPWGTAFVVRALP